MITTTLLALLAATDVNSAADVEAPKPKPAWAFQLSLGAPTVLGGSFALSGATSGALGGLGALGVARPLFTNALIIERAFGEQWTGLTSISFGYSAFGAGLSNTSGAAMLGARWYATRAYDGFFVGPEFLGQLNVTESSTLPLTTTNSWGLGVRARAGWTQPFGEHFILSGSAGLGATVALTSSTTASQTLNVSLDVQLAAGLVF